VLADFRAMRKTNAHSDRPDISSGEFRAKPPRFNAKKRVVYIAGHVPSTFHRRMDDPRRRVRVRGKTFDCTHLVSRSCSRIQSLFPDSSASSASGGGFFPPAMKRGPDGEPPRRPIKKNPTIGALMAAIFSRAAAAKGELPAERFFPSRASISRRASEVCRSAFRF